ncbi:MAG: Fe-S cluster assembly protein SufD [Micrococcales bacterium]|nr:Fe-S cluster assembly protein SufD [Micrococcales bacterium]MCL2668807.1 Fe-S cluster assembly protein SufD [Micrococcales bacterium]
MTPTELAVVPEASRAARRTSFDPADFPVPTGREEEWRFTPMEPLAPLFADQVDGHDVVVDVMAAPGVEVSQVGHDDPRVGAGGAPGDRAAAVAWVSADEATVIAVRGTVPDVTTVTLRGHGRAPSAAHLLVWAEPGASGTVVLDHTGTAVLTETVEIVAEQGSDLTVVSLQTWRDDTVHAANHRLRLADDASVKHVVVTLGGALVRIAPDVQFTGPGGAVTALGLSYGHAGQHLEHRLFVDHAVPRCRSQVTYKGALQGDGAHSVWVGDVLIRAAAEGTDTYEQNRNLLLTEGARADSVPNLEIETGLIEGAGHASATGRFDDEQLFYLRSRGIDETEARRLVVRGFFAELLAQVGVAEVTDRIMAHVDAELARLATQPGAVS